MIPVILPHLLMCILPGFLSEGFVLPRVEPMSAHDPWEFRLSCTVGSERVKPAGAGVYNYVEKNFSF